MSRRFVVISPLLLSLVILFIYYPSLWTGFFALLFMAVMSLVVVAMPPKADWGCAASADAMFANAVGAAIAQVSGECDQIFKDMTRNEALAAAQGIANDRAVAAGAERKTLSTIESEDMPLAYLPGNSVRVRVRVVGDVAGS